MPVPDYLERHYWWAYVRTQAVRFWDRPWLINLILYGNYIRLRDEALKEFSGGEKALKISSCYGSLTPALAEKLQRGGGHLHEIDVLDVQIENARRKSKAGTVTLAQMNADTLAYADDSFDSVLIFFLFHEMPQDWRERTFAEALRVLRPGGKMVIVDFGKPEAWHPFRYGYLQLLGFLEPFARVMWRRELAQILPVQMGGRDWQQSKYFGGLFQKLVATK